MSLITLQYGQCGNQIGEAFFANVHEDMESHSNRSDPYVSEIRDRWFNICRNDALEPRSVVIDTESKAAQFRGLAFKFKNVFAKSNGGSANNWAFGYSDRSKLLQRDVMEAVRGEVEKCELLSSFLNIFSSSGGTGSGVGSAVIECLREEYPNKIMGNAIVLPFANGELVTQSYNTLLTLPKIYSITDFTVVFENDRYMYICKNSLDVKNVDYSDINSVIAQQLASVFQPIKEVYGPHLLSSLASHPDYKLLQLRSAPLSKTETYHNFKYLLSPLLRQPRYDLQPQSSNGLKAMRPKNLATALICRGAQAPSGADLKPLFDARNCVSWLPDAERLQVLHQPKRFQGFESFASYVVNSNGVCGGLNSVVKDAWGLFRYGAYLHHYKKYGVNEEHFVKCFEGLERILHNYKNLQ